MAKKGKLTQRRRKKDSIEPPVRFRRYQYLFLIVCEDENTEKVYFENFQKKIPEESLYLKTVGTGRDPKGVVEQAVRERKLLEAKAKREVDETWVVFDKDDADLNEQRISRFEEAFEIANEEDFKTAYSNEVFELWLLLHLIDVDYQTAIPRKEVYQVLESTIQSHDDHENFVYQHGNASILEKIELIGDEKKAIERAEALFTFQKDIPPIAANPSTKVHLLVKQLHAWIKYFSYNPKN